MILIQLLRYFLLCNRRIDSSSIQKQITLLKQENKDLKKKVSQYSNSYQFQPIGYLESTYTARNYTPNQSTRCPSSKARIKLNIHQSKYKEGSFDSFDEFSHCWVIFVFHKNTNLTISAKIQPPRKTNKGKVGAFSCRTPHRPNPIGLSLVKIDKLDKINGFLYLSSIDLIDGTPILDVKPYIPSHDQPMEKVLIADWVEQTSNIEVADFKNVIITDEALKNLKQLPLTPLYENHDELLQTFQETCKWDGRKKYSKESDSWIVNLANIDFICEIQQQEIKCIGVKSFKYQ